MGPHQATSIADSTRLLSQAIWRLLRALCKSPPSMNSVISSILSSSRHAPCNTYPSQVGGHNGRGQENPAVASCGVDNIIGAICTRKATQWRCKDTTAYYFVRMGDCSNGRTMRMRHLELDDVGVVEALEQADLALELLAAGVALVLQHLDRHRDDALQHRLVHLRRQFNLAPSSNMNSITGSFAIGCVRVTLSATI